MPKLGTILGVGAVGTLLAWLALRKPKSEPVLATGADANANALGNTIAAPAPSGDSGDRAVNRSVLMFRPPCFGVVNNGETEVWVCDPIGDIDTRESRNHRMFTVGQYAGNSGILYKTRWLPCRNSARNAYDSGRVSDAESAEQTPYTSVTPSRVNGVDVGGETLVLSTDSYNFRHLSCVGADGKPLTLYIGAKSFILYRKGLTYPGPFNVLYKGARLQATDNLTDLPYYRGRRCGFFKGTGSPVAANDAVGHANVAALMRKARYT